MEKSAILSVALGSNWRKKIRFFQHLCANVSSIENLARSFIVFRRAQKRN